MFGIPFNGAPSLPVRGEPPALRKVVVKILIVNCNTSAAVTADIVRSAEAVKREGTEIIGVEPRWGVVSAEGFYESYISAAAVLDRLATWTEPIDAVVMAGFGEHGREGARQLLEVPVVDITEAAAMAAMLVGHRFGVVTTLASTIAGIEASLLLMGADARCAGVRAAELPVVSAGEDLAHTVELLAVEAEVLRAQGADAIVLGCAGFAGLDRLLAERLGMPVVDGVAAAVALCESLVQLGLRTSKAGPYAPVNPAKPTPGWPVSTRLDG